MKNQYKTVHKGMAILLKNEPRRELRTTAATLPLLPPVMCKGLLTDPSSIIILTRYTFQPIKHQTNPQIDKSPKIAPDLKLYNRATARLKKPVFSCVIGLPEGMS